MDNKKNIDLDGKYANAATRQNENFKDLMSLLLTNDTSSEMTQELEDILREKIDAIDTPQVTADDATSNVPLSITGDNNVNIVGDNNNDCNVVIMELISLVKERDKEIKLLHNLIDANSKKFAQVIDLLKKKKS